MQLIWGPWVKLISRAFHIENNQEGLRAILSVTVVGISLPVVKSLCCLSGVNPFLVGQMLLKVFSCPLWLGEKEKAVEIMGAWKTQPNSSWPLSLALDSLFTDQQGSAGKGQETRNWSTWHCPSWLKARYNNPHGSTSYFSERFLKVWFGRASFMVKGLKQKRMKESQREKLS